MVGNYYIAQGFREELCKIAEDKISGGLADNKPVEKYSPEQLAMGIKVEREHTTDPDKAKEIAMDHLEEIPDYYTRLKRMEDEAEKK